MKIILVVVTSLDGKTTKWNLPDVAGLSSKEDQKYFFSTLNKNKLIIMGRKTFEVANPDIYKPPKKLRVVITKNPGKYKNVKDRLEFTNDSPKKILSNLTKRGFKQALLVGGAQINDLFLKANLVDEVWQTIEPKIFGMGNGLAANSKFDIGLKLLNSKKLNKNGTLLLKYKVL
ncbi:MAG: dihydrofolate reductase family protein [Candidatus Levybacteria bacterium]|nr:dihydrofolate reductase family protein [Candidatus Levybacteria bacterium]